MSKRSINSISCLLLLFFSLNSYSKDLPPPSLEGHAMLLEIKEDYIDHEGKLKADEIERSLKITTKDKNNREIKRNVKLVLAKRAHKSADPNQKIDSLLPLYLQEIDLGLIGKSTKKLGQTRKDSELNWDEMFLYMPVELTQLSEEGSGTLNQLLSSEQVQRLIKLRDRILPSFKYCLGSDGAFENGMSCTQTYCKSWSRVNLPEPQKFNIPVSRDYGVRNNTGSTTYSEFTFARTSSFVDSNMRVEELNEIDSLRNSLTSTYTEMVSSHPEASKIKLINQFLSHYFDGAFAYIHVSKSMYGVSKQLMSTRLLSIVPDFDDELALVTGLPVEIPQAALDIGDKSRVTIPAIRQMSMVGDYESDEDELDEDQDVVMGQGEPISDHNYYGLLGQGKAVVVVPDSDVDPSVPAELYVMDPDLTTYGAFVYWPSKDGSPHKSTDKRRVVVHPFVGPVKATEEAWERSLNVSNQVETTTRTWGFR